MPKYRRRAYEVEAFRFLDRNPKRIETTDGVFVITKGQWLVKNHKGQTFIMQDKPFRDAYEAIDEAGRAEMSG